jgi:hypothetical protein
MSVLGFRVVLLAVAAAAAVAFGSDSIPALATRVAPDSAGKLALEVSGVVPDSAHWLGVSFYLPGYTDAVWQGEHSVYSVKGPLKFSTAIPTGYEKGTYEAGLWQTKPGENVYYKPSGLKAYGSGTVAKGPDTIAVPDSLARLTSEVTVVDGKTVLKVSGKAQDQRWLGVSFYKAAYADPVLDGSYSMLSVPKGPFAQVVAVPSGFSDGTYEVALWKQLDAKKKVFKLAGLLAYGSGTVGK